VDVKRDDDVGSSPEHWKPFEMQHVDEQIMWHCHCPSYCHRGSPCSVQLFNLFILLLLLPLLFQIFVNRTIFCEYIYVRLGSMYTK